MGENDGQVIDIGAMAKIAFCFGTSILVNLFAVLVLMTTAYFLGLTWLPSFFIIGSILGGVYLISALHKVHFYPFKSFTWLLFVLLYAFLLFSTIWISSKIIDFSYDGQSYHQQAILQMVSGWNPVREDMSSFGQLRSQGILFQDVIVTYTKGSWEIGAAISTLTGNIEDGKAVNFMITAAAFLITFATISTIGNSRTRFAIFISGILVFNPINITQLFSFYVDGILSSLLLILLCLLWQIFYKNELNIIIALIAIVGLIVNIKFNGAVTAIIFCFGFLALLYITHKKTRKKYLASLTAAMLIGIVLLGYSPYITNILNREDATSYLALDINTPKAFLGLSAPQKLFYSIFSTVNNNTLAEPKIKIPFSISSEELFTFMANDVRISGFGPLFGGCLILALLCLLLLKKRILVIYPLLPLTVFLGLLIISIFINPEAWWARYVPQLWFLPVVVVLMVFNNNNKVLRFLCKSLSYVLLLNILLVSFFYGMGQIYGQNYYFSQINQISALSTPVEVKFQNLIANRIRFDYWHIQYKESNLQDCKSQITLYRSDTIVCIEDK